MDGYKAPGITEIRIIKAGQIPAHAQEQSESGLYAIALTARGTKISMVGIGEMSVEATHLNGTPQKKVTLQFKSLDAIAGEHIGVVVTTADGSQWLIGTREGRHPIAEWTETSGQPGGTGAVRTYKITHIARKTPLRCVL